MFNLKVYLDSRRRIPEVTGLHGRVYPGQLAPRPFVIAPRRPELLPEHRDDWRRIGSRRPANTITINVTPASDG